MKLYVTTGDDGFVDGWYSCYPPENAESVETSKKNAGNLDCIKIVDGQAVLDEEKRQKVQKELDKKGLVN